MIHPILLYGFFLQAVVTDRMMTICVAILAGVPTLVTAMVGIIVLLTNHRTSQRIEEVHLIINSRMDQLLRLTRESSFAVGVRQEQAATPGSSTVTLRVSTEDAGKR